MFLIVNKLRFVLAVELIAYFFAAPYIILLGLDENRGLLDQTVSMNYRIWAYALLVGIYPFLLMIISPCIGRQLDQRTSKVSILRKIHLANSSCYMLLALSSWLHSYPLAIFSLCIPGVVGCASPVGKSLIATVTKPEARVQEFAKLAFIKGIAKLIIPLIGAFIFKVLLNESSYELLFVFSSLLSFSCFLYSFTFPNFSFSGDTSVVKCDSHPSPTLKLLRLLVRKNYPLLFTFVLLITGYSVFIKFSPFVLFEQLGHNPSIVNYFASLVGLAYSLNQIVIVHFADQIKQFMGGVFVLLCSTTLLLCFIGQGPFWFLCFFAVLFCYSVLNTCIEARLSLQGISSSQGTVQGLLYSLENWGYIIAPLIGSFVASFSTLSPLYFVMILVIMAGFFFIYSQRFYSRLKCET